MRLTKTSKKAAAKGASRFYDNEAVSLRDLGAPLVVRAREAVKEHCQAYALCVHDVSPLHYTNHPSKTDRRVMYSRDDLGYELQSALLVSDHDGAPLAPGCLNLAASDGVHSTRRETLLPERPWVDELNRTMGHLEAQQFNLPLVHIIDREGDKLLHLRRFNRCGRRFVIRANDVRRVEHEGQSRLLSEVEATLKGQFKFIRKVQYKGKTARQYVAETRVMLKQPACIYRKRRGKLVQRNIAGHPLELRLVVAQVRDKKGRVLATWRLWTNLPAEVEAATIALWYYWRWRIESFFKLLKRAGQHTGAVWPHDNALIAHGLARYGLGEQASHLLVGLFEASLCFELHRMPELFCGFPRRPGEGPVLYPVACAPQAWSAASVFLLFQCEFFMNLYVILMWAVLY